MANKKSGLVNPRGRSNIPSQGDIHPAQREHMIREAAYFQYVQRGFAPGHDLDDWLAAEAEFFRGAANLQPPEPSEPVETMEFEMQQSGAHGAWQDDALKGIVKQHPQKGIPQVEGIEAREAPPKE